ncbi:hypothetical protein AC629_04010 [Bradyrhizobium sp. NAS80.1]|uniref:hypothetical protein n=1 Tax=Bradyrhizobium sp. NAS80.1 TaxID=1680159 RepID=UPI0009631F9C|nr:hypothetical protein [Bradyrhizobium sp. NAS80.1]OKO90742.1 hypothetical protein AC629_04010 [Bradyrhizobium sp. NAS80.1]
MNKQLKAAAKQSLVFLKAPHETMRERADSLESGAVLARQVIELAVRGGRDDLAMRALELAQDLERQA